MHSASPKTGICGYVLLALVLLAVIFCGWGNYAVLALNRYGTRQSVLHVIFFFPRKTGQQVRHKPRIKVLLPVLA